MPKVSDILRDGRDRIMEPSTWCQGSWALFEVDSTPGDYSAANTYVPTGHLKTLAAGSGLPQPIKWCSDGSLLRSVAEALNIDVTPVALPWDEVNQRVGYVEDGWASPFMRVQETQEYQDALFYLRHAIFDYYHAVGLWEGMSIESCLTLTPAEVSITGFNDYHPHDTVLAAWDAAIKMADEEGD